ncbi:hypothetical protein ACXG98_001281 [Pseudomonas aeruginosa]|nr:toll/interleukin-1 receptor domain-containing protein [Pseudomonas aeruginosa]
MYVGFELNNYNCLTFPSQDKLDGFQRQAKGCYDGLSNYLIGVIENKEVVDAQKIADHIFPAHEADVFLSHSHADKDKAIELAVSLQAKGLKVFVDSCVWGYFHDLLDELNDIYAQPVRTDYKTTYNYRKATDLTAGVHMMLTGALHAMIKRSEIFIFLNTDKSVPLEAYQGFDRTFSPWIYSELQFSFHVENHTPKRRLRVANESYEDARSLIKSTASVRSDALLAFKAFNRHLPKITGKQMQDWYSMSHRASEELTQSEVAMDALYDTLAIVERFGELKYLTNKSN